MSSEFNVSKNNEKTVNCYDMINIVKINHIDIFIHRQTTQLIIMLQKQFVCISELLNTFESCLTFLTVLCFQVTYFRRQISSEICGYFNVKSTPNCW